MRTIDELRGALEKAKAETRTAIVHVESDPLVAAPDSGARWDVPVAQVSGIESTRNARAEHEAAKQAQRLYL